MSVDVVRLATDEQVLDALLTHGRLTRAGVAEATGISKPTASQSILRLAGRGLVREAGRQEGGRGRAGTYCEIAPSAGLAVALHAGPGAVVTECLDAAGRVRHRSTQPVGNTIEGAELVELLVDGIASVERAAGMPLPARALSVADPVDRRRRLVHLAGSPFVRGDVDLADVVGPAGIIDNDVAWAAMAELRSGSWRADATFAYVHLGAGLGAGLIDAGRHVAGARGLAGEIAYMLTVDAAGRPARLLDVLRDLRLTIAGTNSLDVAKVGAALAGVDRRVIVGALAGALASLVALLEPEAIVLGGPWGGEQGLTGDIAAALRSAPYRAPHEVRVVGSSVEDAPLVGVRLRAAELARAQLLAGR